METCKGLCKEGSKYLKLRQATGGGCFPQLQRMDGVRSSPALRGGLAKRVLRRHQRHRGNPPRLVNKRPRVWPAAGRRAPPTGGTVSRWHLAEALRLSGPGGMHLGCCDLCPSAPWWGYGGATEWQGRERPCGCPACPCRVRRMHVPTNCAGCNSVGELAARRPSGPRVSALGTPVGARWCKASRVAWHGRGIPCPSCNTDQGVYGRPQAMLCV